MTNRDEHQVETGGDWLEEYEGQLAIDVYQTPESVVIKAPIAGVKPADLDITVNDEVVTIKGHRRASEEIEKENYFVQECYWGAFSRSYVLPIAADAESSQAALKDGILIITIPKQERTRTRTIKVLGS
jgi:HSP20 family protein